MSRIAALNFTVGVNAYEVGDVVPDVDADKVTIPDAFLPDGKAEKPADPEPVSDDPEVDDSADDADEAAVDEPENSEDDTAKEAEKPAAKTANRGKRKK